jgi:hypothetical protein
VIAAVEFEVEMHCGSSRRRERRRRRVASLNLAISLLTVLLQIQLCFAVIRNNRVILHDEHLPNEADGEEDRGLEEIEGQRVRGRLTEREEEEEEHIQGERAKRALADWRGEWRRKASKWGQTEEEQTRWRREAFINRASCF